MFYRGQQHPQRLLTMRTSAGFFMSREDRNFDKPPLTLQGMVELLESRGLIVADTEKARHYLRYINYYRLSGYGYLFEEEHLAGNRSHIFRPGTSFDMLLALYVFDRHLRLLVMDAIERIEVAFRTVMACELSHKYQSGHWFMDPQWFKDSDLFKHAVFLEKVKFETSHSAAEGTERHQSRECFISHYYQNYDSPELPPVWMLIEVMTLGTWSRVYAHLKESKARKQISRVFDLAPDMLDSWMHSLTYLRNRCAHHSQIYGRPLLFPPSMRPDWPALPAGSFSRYIAVLEYMLRKVAPGTGWGIKVKELIQGEPHVTPAVLGITNNDFWECQL